MGEDVGAKERKAAFIEKFELENELTQAHDEDTLTREEQEEITRHRGAVVFWSFMAVLGVAPFILSGTFLYMLARYDALIGDGGLKFLSEVLSSAEVDQMSQQTGVPELQFFVDLYEQRHLIIAAIFTLFFGAMAILLFSRSLIIYLRNR